LHKPRISWSTFIHQITTIELVEYSSVPNLLLRNLFLESDRTNAEATDEPEVEEVYYAKLNLSRGTKGIYYDIVYGIVEEEKEIEP
jgi:hypothetical protein